MTKLVLIASRSAQQRQVVFCQDNYDIQVSADYHLSVSEARTTAIDHTGWRMLWCFAE